MAVRLVIPGVVPAAIPQYPEYVRAWKSYDDPPSHWYKLFSSMQYDIYPVPHYPLPGTYRFHYRLTPVVGRPVYTFDEMESFIDASKTFTVDLFTKNFVAGVAQYRVHLGPPRQHTIYRLPPDWTWNDDHKDLQLR